VARTKANVHVPGVRTPAARPHVSSRRTQVSCAYRLPTPGTTGWTLSWRIHCWWRSTPRGHRARANPPRRSRRWRVETLPEEPGRRRRRRRGTPGDRELVTTSPGGSRLSQSRGRSEAIQEQDTGNHPILAGRCGGAPASHGTQRRRRRGNDQGRAVNQMPTGGDGISNTVRPGVLAAIG